MSSQDFKRIVSRHEGLKSDASMFRNHCEEIRKLVRPEAGEFFGKSQAGDKRHQDVFDPTAIIAAEALAAMFSSYVIPANMRWFNLGVYDDKIMRDDNALLYYELTADAIYGELASPNACFYDKSFENFKDASIFGTGIAYEYFNNSTFNCQFRTYPLAAITIAENEDGVIDTLYRECEYTSKQVVERFGYKTPKKIQDKLESHPFKTWKFLHAVEPRIIRDVTKVDSRNMPYASTWVCLDTKDFVGEGGYKRFPYLVNRFSVTSGEVWGRSQAMACLPAIKLANEGYKLIIQAMQLNVAPPLMVDRDSFLLPIKTYPYGMNFRQFGDGKIEPFIPSSDLTSAREVLNDIRQLILQAFFVDKMMLQKNNVEMRHVEVLQRVDEGLRAMGPYIARMQSEYCNKVIENTYHLMLENGKLDHIQVPEILKQYAGKTRIEYVSPAAKAQMSSKIASFERFTEVLVKHANVNPEVLDIINYEVLGSEISKDLDVSRKLIRNDSELMAIKQQRAQEKQAAQAAQIGQTMATSIKDLSVADKNYRSSE